MKVKYLGPRAMVDVAPYGSHLAGEIKDYPEEFAQALLAESRRQHFEAVAERSPVKPAYPGKPIKHKRSKNHETDEG